MKLTSLRSVGPKIARLFEELGIYSVEELVGKDPKKLYDTCCSLIGKKLDPCVLDAFACAIAQAENKHLPREQKDWWWWSKQRLRQKK